MNALRAWKNKYQNSQRTNGKLIATIAFLVATSACDQADDYRCLVGTWNGIYSCDKIQQDERIRVAESESGLLAIKETGDPCIPAGDTTFLTYGPISDYQVLVKGILPETREVVYTIAEVDLISCDSFQLVIDGEVALAFSRVASE